MLVNAKSGTDPYSKCSGPKPPFVVLTGRPAKIQDFHIAAESRNIGISECLAIKFRLGDNFYLCRIRSSAAAEHCVIARASHLETGRDEPGRGELMALALG